MSKSGRVSFATVVASGSGYDGLRRFYTLQKCDDLAAGNWQPVPGYEALPATGASITYDDPEVATIPKRFYRLKVWLAP